MHHEPTRDNHEATDPTVAVPATELIGARTVYPTLRGAPRPRVYLDSAATTLMLERANAAAQRLLAQYASTHSEASAPAALAAEALAYARREILALAGAGPSDWLAVFAGSGSTACLNWLARSLSREPGPRDIVVLSSLEHHSNDLPHRDRARVVHAPVEAADGSGIDLAGLTAAVREHGERIAYIAVTAASNTTGLIVPLEPIARLARSVGAPLVVDASQYLPHAPLDLDAMAERGAPIDAVVFSGHKTYAPGSPGVAILARALAERLPVSEFGGGMVDAVYEHTFEAHPDLTERLEAGTPNIIGAFTLGVAANTLRSIGMARLHARESALVARLWQALSAIDGVRLYGPAPSVAPRTGCVSFNLDGLDHGLTARILGDHFNIELRSGCFCAEPYVRRLLKPEVLELDIDPDAPDVKARITRRLGLVRASLGLHNTEADVDALAAAVAAVAADREGYRAAYREVGETDYEYTSPVAPRPGLASIIDG